MYTLIAVGAAGADSGAAGAFPGRGIAVITGYRFVAGQNVTIVVGQRPVYPNSATFGGGGSFVSIYNASVDVFSARAPHTPVLVAGGGGGASAKYGSYSSANGLDRGLTTSGVNCVNCGLVATGGGGGGSCLKNGGLNGADGTSTTTSTYYPGGSNGGGGFFGNGGSNLLNGQYGGTATQFGGFAFVNGAQGGTGWTPTTGAGFGGGASAWNGGGGGGGYSGGNAGNSGNRNGGGAGGSYDINGASNTATQYTTWNITSFGPVPTNFSAGFSSGDGFVVVSACSPGAFYSGPGVCPVCQPGTYTDSIGSSACIACAAGTFAPTAGLSVCTSCPSFAWSLAGASSCYNNTYPIFALLTGNSGSPGRYIDIGTARVSKPSAMSSLLGASTISFDGSYALICDASNHVIRRVVFSTNTVTLVAGVTGTSGLVDGPGASSRFYYPFGISMSPDGTYALIADCANNAVRKMDLNTFSIITVAGSSCTSTGCAAGSANGPALSSGFNCPYGIDIHPSGNYSFVADRANNLIRRIDFFPSFVVSTVTASTFSSISSAKLSPDLNSLLIAERGNRIIKIVSLTSQAVTNLYTFGNDLLDVDWLGLGNQILMVDYFGNKILLISNPGGIASTFAGSGSASANDGVGTDATFSLPITINVWRCKIPGMGVDTSYAVCQRCSTGKYSNGFGLCVGCASGTFSTGLGVQSSGVCVSCGSGSFSSASGQSSCTACAGGTFSTASGASSINTCLQCAAGTFAPTAGLSVCTSCPSFGWSLAGASSCYNNTYPIFALVTEYDGNALRKIDLGTSAVTTLVTNLLYPGGISISSLGDFALIANSGTSQIYRVNLASTVNVVVLAGFGSTGNTDGIGTNARFNNPLDVKLSRDNTYALIVDCANHAIRRMHLSNNSVVRIAGILSAGYAEGPYSICHGYFF
jgi:hypothetical protein